MGGPQERADCFGILNVALKSELDRFYQGIGFDFQNFIGIQILTGLGEISC